MAEGCAMERELDLTPTWAVATVCAAIVALTFLIETSLHHLGQWFSSKKKRDHFEALEKVKTELMTLGFISLLLTFFGSYVSRICISKSVAAIMLPCEYRKEDERALLVEGQKKILQNAFSDSCPEGKVPVISSEGMHQLHRFIFFLAVFHVIFSAMTMALGRAKIRRWKDWEKDASSPDYEFKNDPSNYRFTLETSFVREHTSVSSQSVFMLYVMSFFRQFFRSVTKTDYLTLRHGFISAHLAVGTKFNFRQFIKRSLDDDFNKVVHISAPLWTNAILVLLLNVHGSEDLFWISTLPLIVVLAVGTKLQSIITLMAIEIKERHTVIQGLPLVKLSDENFWFKQPRLVLGLIHFALFQNAFDITHFFWIWYEFGLRSCFHDNFAYIIARICFGFGVQILCSYVTLPLYALVSQMGTQLKDTIFHEQTAKAVKNWRKGAMKKANHEGTSHGASEDTTRSVETNSDAPPPEINTELFPSSSGVKQLYRHKSTGHGHGTVARLESERGTTGTDVEMVSQGKTSIHTSAQRMDYAEPTEVHLQIESSPRKERTSRG